MVARRRAWRPIRRGRGRGGRGGGAGRGFRRRGVGFGGPRGGPDHFEAGFEDFLGLVVEGGGGVGEVVEQGVHALVEEGGPVFDAGVAAAFGDGLVEGVGGGAGPKRSRQASRKRVMAGGSRGTSETGRRMSSLRGAAERWVAGSKRRRRFDGVAEEVDADGVGLAGGVEVEDAAAGGVFAGLHDGAGAVVAVGLEEGDDALGRGVGAGAEG